MKKILLVDDEPKIRSTYRRLLSDEGYTVLEAENGEAATLFLMTHRDIDVVLLDINMPVVDGPTLRDLWNLYNPGIPVIVTSVYAVENQKLLVPDAADYHDKSDGTVPLLRKVRRALKAPVS
jgi:two-component system cell cycle sensor histidine kinase/response regulator CckA